MSNQIELRQLWSYAVLSEELHFRKAAEKLYISQPGLSKQIQQLENHLQVQLLERDRRQVSLTPAGIYLKQQIVHLKGFLDHTFRHLKDIEQGQIGEIRIGFVGSAMQEVIPNLIKYYSTHLPDLRFALDEMSNQAQVEALQHYQIDLGFVRLATAPKGVCMQPILEENFVLVLPKSHPVQPATFKNIQQFAETPFILFSTDYSSTYYDKIMSIFTDAAFQPKVSHKSIHANTIFRLVENNLGVAIVPKSLTLGLTKAMDLHIIELTEIRQRAILSIAWREEQHFPALAQVLTYFRIDG